MSIKSGRQRRAEIVARRREKSRIVKRVNQERWRMPDRLPVGALAAEPDKLLHDNTYDARPRYYVDQSFMCVDCSAHEVWSAADQKWWYEEAKGKIASRANRCYECRRKRRMRRSQERRIHIEGMIEKHGIDAAALRLRLSRDVLERMRSRWIEDGL